MERTRAHATHSQLIGGVLSLLALGCELGGNLEGLADSLNPEPEYVESPGDVIVEGKFRNLAFDGNTDQGVYVVAIEDGADLMILPFPEGERCSAGPVRGFAQAITRPDAKAGKPDARIPLLVPATEEEPEALRFAGFDCELDELSVAGGALPLSIDFASEPGFIVQDAEAQLWFINPWTSNKERIATGAAPIRSKDLALFAPGVGGAKWMWTLESGELVARSPTFAEVFRAGKGIKRVQHTSAAGGPLLVLESEAGTVETVLASDAGSLQEIASDACEVALNTGQFGLELLYFSPCSDRTLQVYEVETQTRREIRAAITGYKVVGKTDTGPVLLYTTAATDGSSSTLWARWGQNEPIRLGSDGNLSLSRVAGGQQARVVVDWDGTGGTLLIGELGSKLETAASAVTYHTSDWLISDFDGNNGTLYRFGEDGALEELARSIARTGILNDRQLNRALFLTDYDGTEGELVMIDSKRVRPLSKKVRRDSYQFTVQEKRVTLLSDYDEETRTATLKLPSTEYDDVAVVNTGVAESLEVDWPKRGLLYSAPAADPPGIYFAEFY